MAATTTGEAVRQVAITDLQGKTVIKQEPIPHPTNNQILIKLEASGVCATDLHLVKRSIPYLQPTVNICGHEGIGRIVEIGPNVDGQKWKVGYRVSHDGFTVSASSARCVGMAVNNYARSGLLVGRMLMVVAQV